MRVLICLSGLEGRTFVTHALARLPNVGVELALLYVIDTRPADDLGYVRRTFFPGRVRDRDDDRAHAEDEIVREVLSEVIEVCEAVAPTIGITDRIIRRGHPQHEIITMAQSHAVDLIVIGSRHHGAALTGPRSIGHVARFVLDHAPCDVLLLRSISEQ